MSGVPDFKAMHAKWEARQAAKKALNVKKLTVPEVRRKSIAGRHRVFALGVLEGCTSCCCA